MDALPEVRSRRTLAKRRISVVAHAVRTLPGAGARFLRQSAVSGRHVNLVAWTPVTHESFHSVSRVLQRGLTCSGLPWEAMSSGLGDHTPREHEIVGPATIAHVPLGNAPVLAMALPRAFARGRFVADVSYSETLDVKSVHRLGLPLVDEVWTISEFSAEGFRRITSKPVRVFPYPLPAHKATPGALRNHLGLRDRFVFGFQFDARSTVARKNPEGVIRAYRAAFPHVQHDTVLVIKTLHGAEIQGTLEVLHREAGGRADIRVVDEYWPDDVNAAFFADIDCYVSLHRAEGLGIGMGMAMAAGTPVIATGYSGNVDFMSDDSAVLVPYRLVPIGAHPYYLPTSLWAEPDLDVAADAMRALRSEAALREQLGSRARDRVATYTDEALGCWLDDHLPS